MHASSLAGLRFSHRWCPRFAECGLSVLHGFHHNGVRFNFVYFTAKDLPPLLYDVTNDPGESVDLAQNAEYAEVVLLATTELLSHRMAHAECATTFNPTWRLSSPCRAQASWLCGGQARADALGWCGREAPRGERGDAELPAAVMHEWRKARWAHNLALYL